MKRRRINYGLIALLLTLTGLIVWLIVEGHADRKSKADMEAQAHAYVTTYLEHALLPKNLREMDFGADTLTVDTFMARPEIETALAAARTDLEPYFVSNPEAWTVMETRLAEDWMIFSQMNQQVHDAPLLANSDQDEYPNIVLNNLEPIYSVDLIHDEATFSMFSTLSTGESNLHWTSFDFQMYREAGQWRINAVNTQLVEELLSNNGQVFSGGLR